MAYHCLRRLVLVTAESIIDNLLSKHGSIFFTLCNKVLGIAAQLIRHSHVLHILSLSGSNISNHGLGIGIIMLCYFMSGFLQYPIVLVIIVVTPLIHQILEYFPHVVVIGSLFKLEIPTVLQIRVEFFRHTPGKRFNCCGHLLVFNSIVLVVFIFSLEALPREVTFQEIK